MLSSRTFRRVRDLARGWRGLPEHVYQGVFTPFNMSALHSGRFAEVYDRVYRQDPALGSSDVIRLRAYFAFTFARWALASGGDYISAGVAYAVQPKLLYELVVKGSRRRYHLIDPMVDSDGPTPSYVRGLFGGDPAVALHRERIPDAFPIPVPRGIAFAHLATGNVDAEVASLPFLIRNLADSGATLIDEYGWHDHAGRYDEAAAREGADIITLPTGQGLVLAPCRHTAPRC